MREMSVHMYGPGCDASFFFRTEHFGVCSDCNLGLVTVCGVSFRLCIFLRSCARTVAC